MQPKISAICLTKNRPQWMARMVEVLRRQTWKNLEIIIAERSDVFRYAQVPAYPNIKHFKMGNAGIVPRNQKAMLAATGDLIAYIDDDDYFAPDRLERQAAPLLAGECSMNGMKRHTLHTVLMPAMTWGRLSWVDRPKDSHKDANLGSGLPSLACSDGTVMFKADRFQGPSDPGLKLQKIGFLRTMLKRSSFKLFDGSGLYVYVRHASNLSTIEDGQWKFEETTRPAFVPKDQRVFWEVMIKRGVASGA